MTGASHSTLRSSTSMPSATAVIAFVVEPMAKRVPASTAPALPTSRTPYPFTKTTRSSFTTAIARPGTRQSRTARATYASSSVRSTVRGACCAADGAGTTAVSSAAVSTMQRTRITSDMICRPLQVRVVVALHGGQREAALITIGTVGKRNGRVRPVGRVRRRHQRQVEAPYIPEATALEEELAAPLLDDLIAHLDRSPTGGIVLRHAGATTVARRVDGRGCAGEVSRGHPGLGDDE